MNYLTFEEAADTLKLTIRRLGRSDYVCSYMQRIWFLGVMLSQQLMFVNHPGFTGLGLGQVPSFRCRVLTVKRCTRQFPINAGYLRKELPF